MEQVREEQETFEQFEAEPVLTDVPGPRPAVSVGEALRETYARAQARKEEDFPIPGWLDHHGQPQLIGTFRAVGDFGEVYKAFAPGAKRRLSEDRMTVQYAINMLTMQSVEVHAVINGERHDFGVPLGMELYNELFPESTNGQARPQTDQEALVLLFPNGTASIVELATQVDLWQKGQAAPATEDEILGEY